MKMTITIRSSTCSSPPVLATMASEVSRPRVMALKMITPTIVRWKTFDSISRVTRSRVVPGAATAVDVLVMRSPSARGVDHATLRDDTRSAEHCLSNLDWRP
jgi:hypothetical protein